MSTLHYRCSFDLTSRAPERSFEALLKTVRKWIAERPKPPKGDDFWKAWFFQGGSWRSPTYPGIRVLTQNCYGDCTPYSPNCWAAEYEHPCDEFPACRFWKVHIGIEQSGHDHFHLNFQTLYDMRPGHFGPEPVAPLPSSPRIIMTLLRSNYWRCMGGSEELSTCARVLQVGQGHLFAQLIANDRRTCPIVLLSQIYPDKGSTLDGARLAKFLAGAAIVYQSESSEVDDELDNLLGEQFSCRRGAVRIYVPGLDFTRAGDERRHRFLLPRDIDDWGPDKTVDIIVRGIARRSTRPKGVLTPLDVEAVNRQRRLVQLRANQNDASKDEWVPLLDMLEKENKDLQNDKTQIEADLQDRIDSLQDDVRRLQLDKEALKYRLEQANAATDQPDLKTVLEKIKQLPRTLSEAVEVIAAIYPQRIAFTDRAVRSAREADFDDVSTAWRGLWAMATTLYDVLFEQNGGNKQKAFHDRSGFELAMTEGKQTNQDKRLKALRKDSFMGCEIDITAHVKLDRDSTRAYFRAFQQNGTKLIVVGHIGNHLDTAGTRRRGS
jgi:hypothetical protein